nr:ABC transporter F family member 4-like [Aegilops tauschii subsp. strangulata]
MLEEKKRKEMDIIRKTLEKEVKRQHELLQINMKASEEVRGSQSGEKTIESEDEKEDTEGEAAAEDKHEEGEEMTHLELIEQAVGLGYMEPVDYTASQETDSFETKIKKAGKGDLESQEEEELRRCSRLKGKEDKKITELAKERVAQKNNYDKPCKK